MKLGPDLDFFLEETYGATQGIVTARHLRPLVYRALGISPGDLDRHQATTQAALACGSQILFAGLANSDSIKSIFGGCQHGIIYGHKNRAPKSPILTVTFSNLGLDEGQCAVVDSDRVDVVSSVTKRTCAVAEFNIAITCHEGHGWLECCWIENDTA